MHQPPQNASTTLLFNREIFTNAWMASCWLSMLHETRTLGRSPYIGRIWIRHNQAPAAFGFAMFLLTAVDLAAKSNNIYGCLWMWVNECDTILKIMSNNLMCVIHKGLMSILSALYRRCWLLVCIPVRSVGPLAYKFAHHCGACQGLLWFPPHHSCQQLSGLHKIRIPWQAEKVLNSRTVKCRVQCGTQNSCPETVPLGKPLINWLQVVPVTAAHITSGIQFWTYRLNNVIRVLKSWENEVTVWPRKRIRECITVNIVSNTRCIFSAKNYRKCRGPFLA